MDTVTLNGAKLKEIAHKSHTATVTATSLALRERLRHSSDITRTRAELARQGERIVEADYMQFWKDLQVAGVGSIVYGRKGKPDRFDWYYSLKSIAKACIDGSNVQAVKVAGPMQPEAPKVILRPKSEVAPKREEVKVRLSDKVSTSSGDRLVYIPLRSNFDVEIKVPVNFTKDEAELLSKALLRAAI